MSTSKKKKKVDNEWEMKSTKVMNKLLTHILDNGLKILKKF